MLYTASVVIGTGIVFELLILGSNGLWERGERIASLVYILMIILVGIGAACIV